MDLNIIIEKDNHRDSSQVIRQKVTKSRSLGYHTIALAVVVDLNDKISIPNPPDVNPFAFDKLEIYTRLTVKVSESSQLYKLSKSPETSKYDLIALEPQNAIILKYISTGQANLDILTFNICERLDFNLFKISYSTLEDRGVCTEINYGPAQLGSSLRRNIICNGQNIIEKTTKNVILSSGIDDAFRLRSPLDARSIGLLFLMSSDRCHDSVHKNAKKAINLSKFRKQPASSAIELIKTEKL